MVGATESYLPTKMLDELARITAGRGRQRITLILHDIHSIALVKPTPSGNVLQIFSLQFDTNYKMNLDRHTYRCCNFDFSAFVLISILRGHPYGVISVAALLNKNKNNIFNHETKALAHTRTRTKDYKTT